MLGFWIFIILIIFIAICITPWWFVPSIVVGTLVYQWIFGDKTY